MRSYMAFLSTIPDILRFRVFDTVGKRPIGSLDQRFIGDYGENGNIFVLKGMHWRIMNVDDKALTVNVEPYRAKTMTVPYWEGELLPVDARTAKKVGHFRTKIPDKMSETAPDLMPAADAFYAESHRLDGTVVLHCCLGTRINNTLSSLLSSLLSSILGYAVESRSDAYRIVFSSNSRLSEDLLNEALRTKYDIDEVIATSLQGTHNINWKTWSVCKKFGIVERKAIYERKSARFLCERYYKTPVVREALRELYHDKFDIPGTKKIIELVRLGKMPLLDCNYQKILLSYLHLDHSKILLAGAVITYRSKIGSAREEKPRKICLYNPSPFSSTMLRKIRAAVSGPIPYPESTVSAVAPKFSTSEEAFQARSNLCFSSELKRLPACFFVLLFFQDPYHFET